MGKKPQPAKRDALPRQVENRRARFDYQILDTYEAGVALVGSEVKSILFGRANLTDAYCRVQGGELWLLNADVEPFDKGSAFQPERRRDRKLLMHKKEIGLLERKSMEKGLTIVPLKLYFNHGKVKVLIALGRGKGKFDKREQIAARETKREQQRLKSGLEH